MNPTHPSLPALLGAAAACLLVAGSAVAQDAAPATVPLPGLDQPTPWYVGVSQGFTHDSNVYNVPSSATSDTYSTSRVFGGFEQRLSRQRLHGSADVGLNRYFNETRLDNTSYGLALGLDWATIFQLSGDLDLGMNQNLTAPAASAGVPSANKNLARTRTLGGAARWGGASLLTLEATGRHSSLDYSSPDYVASESNSDSGSLTMYYRPGGPLRLGIGGRYDRTRTPKAAFDPLANDYDSNTSQGKHLDLIVDYDVSGAMTSHLLLSYTKKDNSLVGAADFSGFTGKADLHWRPTGRLNVFASASRDAGFNSTFSTVFLTPEGSPEGTSPIRRLYENNRLTYAADLGVRYSVTAKISASAGGAYSRSKLVSTASADVDSSNNDSTDVQRSVYLAGNYQILRSWSMNCRLARELRTVSGRFDYGYDSNSIGCSTRFVYR